MRELRNSVLYIQLLNYAKIVSYRVSLYKSSVCFNSGYFKTDTQAGKLGRISYPPSSLRRRVTPKVLSHSAAPCLGPNLSPYLKGILSRESLSCHKHSLPQSSSFSRISNGRDGGKSSEQLRKRSQILASACLRFQTKLAALFEKSLHYALISKRW